MTDNTPRNPLLVRAGDLNLIRAWPLALRALFDPQADRDLAERCELQRRQSAPWPDSDPPF